MPHRKESIMRRLLTYFGLGPKRQSVKDLEARTDALVARRKAKRNAPKREPVPA